MSGVGALAVFDEASSWLPYDGDDNCVRERFSEARAAVAELVERDRAATQIFDCMLRAVNDLTGPMGHRSESFAGDWIASWAAVLYAAGFKSTKPEANDIARALANVGGVK